MNQEQSEQKEINKAVRRFPAPRPGVKVTIPIHLWPAYAKLHSIEPDGYLEEESTLIVKKGKP